MASWLVAGDTWMVKLDVPDLGGHLPHLSWPCFYCVQEN